MATQTKSEASAKLTKTDWRRLRIKLHRFWKLPKGMRLATPAFSGIFILTMTSLGITVASWSLTRLLPNIALVKELIAELPRGIWGLLGRLPELLAATTPSSTLVTGALVTQDAYVITYACGAATIFCFLLLLVAFIKRW